MPSLARRAAIATAMALTLGSCVAPDPRAGMRTAGPPRLQRRPFSDLPVKIGAPYQIDGVTYYPQDEPRYDAVGLASWYGHESGEITANGEAFRPEDISAAHKTLPLPSYVEVTVLESGRTILVRVNDRGPFVAGRIIDLSQGAAGMLGLLEGPPAPVRVRRVEPSERDRAQLRLGRMASPRPDAPPQRVAAVVPPPPVPATARRAAVLGGDWFVQLGAFRNRAGAESLLPLPGGVGAARIAPAAGIWRVRVGPFDEAGARAVLAQVRARGYQGAALVRSD